MQSSMPSRWSTLMRSSSARLALGFLAVLVMFPASQGRAQDRSAADPFEELRMRIERLEQENRELRAAVGGGTKPASFSPDVPPSPEEEDEATLEGEQIDEPDSTEETEEEKRLGSIVERYMRRHANRFPARSDSALSAKVGGLDGEVQKLKSRLDKGPTTAWVNDGLMFTSANGDFKTHMGGTAQLDAVAFPYNGGLGVPGGAGTQDSVEFRRMRFRAEGTMYQNMDWVSEFDFALALQNVDPQATAAQNLGLNRTGALAPGNVFGPGGSAGPGTQAGNTMNVIQTSTVFISFKDIPVVGHVRIGNQQDWLSLEHIVSARFQDFMERSPIMDAFNGANNNGYAPGISFYDVTENKMATWQVGAYNNNVYNSGYSYNIGNQWMYGGRATWTPYYDECSKGRYMVHTGLGVQYRQFNTDPTLGSGFDNVRVRSRGVLRNAASTLDPNFADTGNFYSTGQTLLNPEVAVVWDRWFFQGEFSQNFFYGARSNKGAAGPNNFGTAMMSGGYVEALYFLTGEYKEYNRTYGSFGRVVPVENFNVKKETCGGWQVGGRYDWLDLNSKGIQGGIESDWTLGLNWFLNPHARIQFNYVFTEVSNQGFYAQGPLGSLVGSRFQGDGLIQSVGTRMDFNF